MVFRSQQESECLNLFIFFLFFLKEQKKHTQLNKYISGFCYSQMLSVNVNEWWTLKWKGLIQRIREYAYRIWRRYLEFDVTCNFTFTGVHSNKHSERPRRDHSIKNHKVFERKAERSFTAWMTGSETLNCFPWKQWKHPFILRLWPDD